MELLQKVSLLRPKFLQALSKSNSTNICVRLTLLIILNLFYSHLASANNIYKCKDLDNNDYFTDNPKSDSNCVNPKKQKIKPLPSFDPKSNSANKTNKSKQPSRYYKKSDDNKTLAKYSQITITYPQNNQAANSCGGFLSVNFSSDPSLYSNDQAQLLINGTPYGAPTKANSISANDLDRGEYTIVIQIIRNNKTVQKSPPVNFTFLRNCARR